MASIIGGMFGLQAMPPPHPTPPPFLSEGNICLVNARSGISLLAAALSPACVWVPSYLCPVILEALKLRTAEIRFYPVSYDLTVVSLDWLDEVRPGDLVILIAYFGFPCDEAVCAQVKQQGAWVLADASQALLSTKIGQSADFVLYSPRKFLGVPDGGILQINHPAGWPDLSLQAPPADWWLKTFTAAILRRDFDGAPPRFPAGQGGERQWLRLYQEAEREAPTGPYAMTELSRSLLLHYFDYPAIAAQRIANYRFLSTHLSEIALYPQLAPGVVPLGFPIRLRDQDRVRQLLFARAIYPPVHWPLAGWVPSEFTDSHRLSTEIMTLPCDQRYALADMESILQALQSC